MLYSPKVVPGLEGIAALVVDQVGHPSQTPKAATTNTNTKEGEMPLAYETNCTVLYG